MAQAQSNLERNTFIKGLITEAGPLTFPKDSSKDELNFVLNKDGSRQRRLGMDYESSYVVNSLTTPISGVESNALASFTWNNVNNDPDLSVGVIQQGVNLWFIDLATTAPSANILQGPLALTTAFDSYFDFSAINGVLVVVGAGLTNPVYIKYDAGVFSASTYSIEVRDIWGVQDDLGINERAATITEAHRYNLLNQGWDDTKINATLASPTVNVYPSNADVWYVAKDTSDNYDPTLLVKQDFGTARAGKGRFIIEAFARGAERQAATGLTTLPTDAEQGRPSVVTSFAGRIFYSGVTGSITVPDDVSPSYSGTVFYSQIIDSNSKLGYCFQEGDPTSEYNNDLVKNDGGTLQIPEAGNILKLIPKENVLLVFAENGVWVVSGPDGAFFADSIAVRKVTNVGAVGKESIVDADGTIVYWAKGGIYQLVADPRSGRLVPQNITERTIQTRYNAIQGVAKKYAVGVFDAPSRRVKWLYNDQGTFNGTTKVDSYDTELALDFVLGAFTISKLSYGGNKPYVSGYFVTPDYRSGIADDPVVVGGDPVVVGVDPVVVKSAVRSRGDSAVKYLTTVKLLPNTPDAADSIGFTLSEYNNSDFLDWYVYDGGTDAAAYVITGEEILGDTQRDKGLKYLTVHCLRTEDGFVDVGGILEATNASSCMIEARWDFSNSSTSGKFGQPFQAYRLTRNYIPSGVGDTFDYGYEIITTKTKVRGRGKSIVLKFYSSPGKDLYLYGWAMAAQGNTVV